MAEQIINMEYGNCDEIAKQTPSNSSIGINRVAFNLSDSNNKSDPVVYESEQ